MYPIFEEVLRKVACYTKYKSDHAQERNFNSVSERINAYRAE
jgi:hypothetical protein